MSKCKCCGEEFDADYAGWIKTPRGRFAGYDHIQSFVKAEYARKLFKANNKAQKEKKKANAKQKREFYDNDIGFRKKAAQKAFNAYIRKRDEKEACISCDKPSDWRGQWHAGHWKTVGARGDIRFNEDNCHKQCSVCNNHLSGNVGEYERRLIERIGIDRVDALLLVKQVKLTASDYKEIELMYKVKLGELL